MGRKLAPIATPIIEAVTNIFQVVIQVASTSVLARYKTTIGYQKFLLGPFAASSNGTSRAITGSLSINKMALSTMLTRIRSTHVRSFTLSTEVSVGALARVGTASSLSTSSSVHTRRTESAIGHKLYEVVLEELHQRSLAVRTSVISGTNAEGLAVASSPASTVVLARIVGSRTNNGDLAISSSIVRIALALESNTSNVGTISTVEAWGTTITKIFFQRVLAKDAIIVTGALADGTASGHEAFSAVLARIYLAKSGGLAPIASPSGRANATELSLHAIIVTNTIVHALAGEAAVQGKIGKSILAKISEITSGAVATDTSVDGVTFAVVFARVRRTQGGLFAPVAGESGRTNASEFAEFGVIVTNTIVHALAGESAVLGKVAQGELAVIAEEIGGAIAERCAVNDDAFAAVFAGVSLADLRDFAEVSLPQQGIADASEFSFLGVIVTDTAVLARAGISAISFVGIEVILAEISEIISGTGARGLSSDERAHTVVHARVGNAAHGLVAPIAGPASVTDASEHASRHVVAASTVSAFSGISAIEHVFRQGIFAKISEIIGGAAADDVSVDDLARSSVHARVRVAPGGNFAPGSGPLGNVASASPVTVAVNFTNTAVHARSGESTIFFEFPQSFFASRSEEICRTRAKEAIGAVGAAFTAVLARSIFTSGRDLAPHSGIFTDALTFVGRVARGGYRQRDALSAVLTSVRIKITIVIVDFAPQTAVSGSRAIASPFSHFSGHTFTSVEALILRAIVLEDFATFSFPFRRAIAGVGLIAIYAFSSVQARAGPTIVGANLARGTFPAHLANALPSIIMVVAFSAVHARIAGGHGAVVQTSGVHGYNAHEKHGVGSLSSNELLASGVFHLGKSDNSVGTIPGSVVGESGVGGLGGSVNYFSGGHFGDGVGHLQLFGIFAPFVPTHPWIGERVDGSGKRPGNGSSVVISARPFVESGAVVLEVGIRGRTVVRVVDAVSGVLSMRGSKIQKLRRPHHSLGIGSSEIPNFSVRSDGRTILTEVDP